MSNPNVDLESVITDAVNDSAIPESVDDTPVEVADDSSTDQVEAPSASDEPAEETATESPSAELDEAPVKDEFERIAGMPQMGVTGRENRIPYSRVKKITERAVNEIAEVALGRKLNPGEKAVDVVKAHVAQLPELQTKVADYEERLTHVGEFERIMEQEPKKFLQMLERVPAYQNFFAFVREAYKAGRSAPNQQPEATKSAADTEDNMPEPDEELADGSRVYSMEGLKSLMAWNARQVENKVNSQWENRYAQLESRYRPIESEWRERRHIEAVLPVIRKQIEEAKTWPMFDEHEAEITQVLEQDPNISLEGAYRKVVFPKLVAERSSMRQQVVQELKQAPKATSVGGKPTTPKQQPSGPRSLEEVIAAEVQKLK